MTRSALTSLPLTRIRTFTTATLAAFVIGSAAPGISDGAFAQSDGTGADSRSEPSECVVVRSDALPALDVATPRPSPATPTAATPTAADSQASPVAIGNAAPYVDEATPVVEPEASPAVGDDVSVNPNDQVVADLTTTIESLFACLNDREFDVYAAMTSDEWHGYTFGIDDPLTASEFVEFAPVLPRTETTLVSATNLQVIDETTVTINVIYTTASQQWTGAWTLAHDRVEGLPAWVLQSETPLANGAPENTAAITVTMSDSSYSTIPGSVNGPNVVLKLHNTTERDHEALVLRLDEGVSTTALLETTTGILPDGATFVGQATVAPGASGDLALVNLEPGVYTIVDLLPDENGLPHLSSGMETTFTVRP